KGHTALLISVTSFPSHTNPVWEGFLKRVSDLIPKSDLVILDLRGNGGGDDTIGKKLSDLLAGTNLETPYKPQWTSQTPESFQILVNSIEYGSRKIKEDEG